MQTSPENPLGRRHTTYNRRGRDIEYDYDDEYDSARQDLAASPESGTKGVTMYSALQEEIKNDARQNSDLDPRGS